MLRENNIACGITTTGTGTLTLAASPASLGALDPYQAFGAMGLGTTLPCFMPYTLVEFADATFAKIVQREKGNGLLLLGANIGATTLARSVVRQTQVVATGANVRGSVQNVIAGITVGTAANCLVFIGPDVDDAVPALPGYLVSGIAQADGLGVCNRVSSATTPLGLPVGRLFYFLISLDVTDVVKTFSLNIAVAMGTAPTTQSSSAALFSLHPATLMPDRKLVDFGSNTTMLSIAGWSSFTATSPARVMAGQYALGFVSTSTGGVGTPSLTTAAGVDSSPWGTSKIQTAYPIRGFYAATGSLTDPASSGTFYPLASASGVPVMAFRNT